MEKIIPLLLKINSLLIGALYTMLGYMKEKLGLDCLPKLSWDFFLGYNPIKPLKDLLFGYVPEGYDQAEEEKLYRLRRGYDDNDTYYGA